MMPFLAGEDGSELLYSMYALGINTFSYKISDNLLYFNFPGEEGTPWYKGVSQTSNVYRKRGNVNEI